MIYWRNIKSTTRDCVENWTDQPEAPHKSPGYSKLLSYSHKKNHWKIFLLLIKFIILANRVFWPCSLDLSRSFLKRKCLTEIQGMVEYEWTHVCDGESRQVEEIKYKNLLQR